MDCYFDSCEGCMYNCFTMYDVERVRRRLLEFLFYHGVVPCHVRCHKCRSTLHHKKNLFRCHKKNKRSNRKCTFKVTILKNTIFNNSRLSLEKVSAIIRIYLSRPPPRVKCIEELTGCSMKTIFYWSRVIRNVLMSWTKENFEKLGGKGRIVEIGEVKLGKRKANKGRTVEETWVFGGLDRSTKKMFLLAVPNREEGTWTEIIKEHIHPGSILLTYSWERCQQLEKEGYNHYDINHSTDFTDPVTGVHTQNLERLWREVRRLVPRFGRGQQFQEYLEECIFMLMVEKEFRLHEFWKAAGKLYPGLPHEPLKEEKTFLEFQKTPEFGMDSKTLHPIKPKEHFQQFIRCEKKIPL